MDAGFLQSVWEKYTKIIKDFNEPGRFTALIGYEWTPNPGPGNNMHRNVVYRDDSELAGQVTPFTTFESVDPEDLWFGLVSGTDTHTALSTAEEDNFFGKHSGVEPSPDRWKHITLSFDGRETYSTTGPRMTVWFFGGWDFTDEDALSREPGWTGYDKGVPMGADLDKRPEGGRSPTFLVATLRDPIGGNLDRIQIIKGWLDAEGKTHEKVYDVVWSGDRKPGADGKLPPVGNTVDVPNATWTNTIGAPELITVWEDPDFNPAFQSLFYARVIQIPTPRWTAYEAKRFKVDMPEEVPMIIQERAYTSPIWYSP